VRVGFWREAAQLRKTDDVGNQANHEEPPATFRHSQEEADA